MRNSTTKEIPGQVAGIAALAAGMILHASAAVAAPEGKSVTTTTTVTDEGVRRLSPDILPGKGIRQHDFVYAGEWDTRKANQSIWVVRDGKVVWSYQIPLKPESGGIQEFDDVTRLSNGDIVFSRMKGAGRITPDHKLIWNYDAPPGTEIHSIQPIDARRVVIMQNGNPARVLIIDTITGKTEKEIVVPTRTTGTHGQFRHIRMTKAGTFLLSHMDMNKVSEYDADGKEIWSVAAPGPWAAVRLKNGNTLISGDSHGYAREVNPKGDTVWELTQKDVPDIRIYNIQEASRLANGNTVICNWCSGGEKQENWPHTVQVLEVTPDKKVVWALREWTDPDLGTSSSIQLLDEPGIPENGDYQR